MVLENEMPFHKQHCLRLNQALVCGEKGKSGGVGRHREGGRREITEGRGCVRSQGVKERKYMIMGHKGFLALSKWPWE